MDHSNHDHTGDRWDCDPGIPDRHYHDTDSAETGWCSGCGRTDLRELDFDEATAAGFDGTGRDLDPRFPYHVYDLPADDGTYDVDGNR